VSQDLHENASLGAKLGHVGKFLTDAESLCRRIAGPDLGSLPLYLLEQSKMPVGLGTTYHYAFYFPHADLIYQDYIADWRGRGPCVVINDIGIAEDFESIDHEYVVTGIVLHELGHVLDRPMLFDEQAYEDSERRQFDALVITDASKRPSRSDVPMYFGHGANFIRIVIHLAYRASLAGFEISPAGIAATHRLGLSPIASYADALGDEPHRYLDLELRALVSHEPPDEFVQRWTADMNRYQSRFPDTKE